jgi:hypothetical protein
MKLIFHVVVECITAEREFQGWSECSQHVQPFECGAVKVDSNRFSEYLIIVLDDLWASLVEVVPARALTSSASNTPPIGKAPRPTSADHFRDRRTSTRFELVHLMSANCGITQPGRDKACLGLAELSNYVQLAVKSKAAKRARWPPLVLTKIFEGRSDQSENQRTLRWPRRPCIVLIAWFLGEMFWTYPVSGLL